MRWQLLIAVIAVAVWILSSLVRGAGEKAVRRPRPNADPDQPPPDRPRRNANEINRFLQEVQRRRQTGDRRPDPDIPMAIPVEPVLAPPRPSRRVARAEAGRPTVERSAQRRSAEAALPRTGDAPAAPAAPAAPLAPWQEPEQLAASPQAPATVAASAPISPVARQLVELLRNPRTQATAFALREVLDRPVSQRRRG